ncbi:STAS domain-containing protein [Kitasatospora sp. NPDC048538]|uniref:STAS domain-containing protein n=1 Tax=unclassified Kitasatospora TaxID=2633591 RepID=UPI00340F3EA2
MYARHAPRLRITTSGTPETALVLHLDGQVDQGEHVLLDAGLARAVKERPPRLVIDLAGLTFCDSTGLNALLRTRLEALATGVELVLASPPPQVKRLLELTGTDGVFTIRDDVPAALTGPITPDRG